MSKIKRSLFRSFLNTGTKVAPVWSLIGKGVTSGSVQYDAQVEEETYIHEDNATTSVESYSPNFPLESSAVKGDAVFAFLDGIRKGRKVLDEAETEIVNVWLYQEAVSGYYVAERQACSIQIDEFGGDGGTSVKLNYTINFLGDPEAGRFDVSGAGTWSSAEAPDSHALTTLTLGSGTLSPLFNSNKNNLFYTTQVAAATVTVSSVKAGSTIVQKCNGTTVAQGDAASLTLGMNTITIAVTVSGTTCTYVIQVKRTA